MKKIVLSKKYLILLVLAICIVVGWMYTQASSGGIPVGVETSIVERGAVREVVSETGHVQAAQAVDMAFERGGRVIELMVQEGSEVMAGDVLARLDASTVVADLTAAQARLEAEQVRLQELLTGADDNSLAVTQSSVVSAETALANAKRNLEEVTTQQNQLVQNAKKTLRNSGFAAYLVSDERESTNYTFTAPTVSGTYTSEEEGVYRLELYNSGGQSGASYRLTGLENGTESVSTVNPTPVGTRGLFVQFPVNFAPRTEWEIPIPNTRSSNYLTNLNAYNAAVESRKVAIATAESAVEAAQATLNQGQTQLTQVSSSARNEKVAAQRALVKQVQAAVAAAQVQYDSMTLVAPFSGIVTKTYTEVGEIIGAGSPAVSLISTEGHEIIVPISEVDIAEVSVDDVAKVTFDAYDDIIFQAHVVNIAPRAELVDGVRVFKVTLTFDDENALIRDGLSADVDIATAERRNVISVPTRAIYEDETGKFVRLITGDNVAKVYVRTGLRGTDGRSEIVDGLSGGETIVTFADQAALAEIEKN